MKSCVFHSTTRHEYRLLSGWVDKDYFADNDKRKPTVFPPGDRAEKGHFSLLGKVFCWCFADLKSCLIAVVSASLFTLWYPGDFATSLLLWLGFNSD